MFKKKEEQIPEEKKQAIFLKIRPVIAKQLEVAEEKITPSTNIIQDLGADSLDALEIIMALEEAFNIEILDEDQDKMQTVEDIITYLVKRLSL